MYQKLIQNKELMPKMVMNFTTNADSISSQLKEFPIDSRSATSYSVAEQLNRKALRS